jgi:hypothetical protein
MTATLEEKMAQLDAQIRVHTLPGHIAKAIEEGKRAERLHEEAKAALLKERAELAEAQRLQISASEYEKRRREREREEAQIAAAQAALRETVDAYLGHYASIVAGLKQAAEGAAAALQTMDRMGALAASLNDTGRRPDATNVLQLAVDLSLLVAASFKAGVPTHKHRFGTLIWPSAADARHRLGGDWAAEEKARLARHILPLAGN